jgi:hypothetical protein
MSCYKSLYHIILKNCSILKQTLTGPKARPNEDKRQNNNNSIISRYCLSIKFVLENFQSNCYPAEKIMPSGAVDLVRNHFCDNGKRILNHCKSGNSDKCNDADPARSLECDYFDSRESEGIQDSH